MIEIRQVEGRKMQKEFLDFPLGLYRDCPWFAPPLYLDEKKIFRPDYVYLDTCEAVYFNAYRDGRMAGRISGILQKAANEKYGQKRVRFTRFDSVNDPQVARALFSAVEDWARSKGMEEVVGPLGFSDLEREGLLIEGFDQMATFEEQYNYDYYASLIESCGYGKEVDWVESRLFPPEDDGGAMDKMSDFLLKRYGLRFGPAKNTRDFLRRYKDGFFELLDESYDQIYGTVPFTDNMKKMMVDNFKLIINLKYVGVLLDKNDRIVCLGLCFPSIGEALQKSRGHLTPAALVRVLRAVKRPRSIDLALVGASKDYANRGISAVIMAALIHMMRDNGIEYAETNLNLEDNYAIRNQWKRFRSIEHKRRRAYIKKL